MSVPTAGILLMRSEGEMTDGTMTRNQVRDLAPILVDEPAGLGGTNQGAMPMEYVLSGLNGCVGFLINRLGGKMRFTYERVTFETEGTVDTRGYAGVPGVRKHFHQVRQIVRIKTAETPERVEQLKALVESRCPVLSLLQDAGVIVETEWVRVH